MKEREVGDRDKITKRRRGERERNRGAGQRPLAKK